MRIFAASAFFVLYALASGSVTPIQAQSAPVQAGKTPQQSDESRAQDRSRAESVKIGRDWRAQGRDKKRATGAGSDTDHETIGRDWLAHPKDRN